MKRNRCPLSTGIYIKYKIRIGDGIPELREPEETPYMFPTQELTVADFTAWVSLNEEEVQKLREFKKNGVFALFSAQTKPKLTMEIEISYYGFKNEFKKIAYLCVYDWNVGKWGITFPPKNDQPS